MIGTILEQDGGESAMVAIITLLVTPASGEADEGRTPQYSKITRERAGNWRERKQNRPAGDIAFAL